MVNVANERFLHHAAQGNGNGGALYYYGSTTGNCSLALISCRFLSNSGDNGGALYVDNAASVKLADNDFSSNEASSVSYLKKRDEST